VAEEEEKRKKKIIQLSPLLLPSTPHVYLNSHQRLTTEIVISQRVTLGVLCFDLKVDWLAGWINRWMDTVGGWMDRTWSVGFRLGSRPRRCQKFAGALPSWSAQADSPGTALTVGGWLTVVG